MVEVIIILIRCLSTLWLNVVIGSTLNNVLVRGSNAVNKPGRPQTPNRQGLYSKIAKFSDLVVDTLVEMLDSRNENIRLGAAKALLDKILPDLKAVSAEVRDVGPLQMTVLAGNGFMPPLTTAIKILTK